MEISFPQKFEGIALSFGFQLLLRNLITFWFLILDIKPVLFLFLHLKTRKIFVTPPLQKVTTIWLLTLYLSLFLVQNMYVFCVWLFLMQYHVHDIQHDTRVIIIQTHCCMEFYGANKIQFMHPKCSSHRSSNFISWIQCITLSCW